MGRAIGIDLGTTNSCAAIIENGKPKVIEHANGQKTIPSVFAIDKQGNRLVGEAARAQAAENPMNTVAAAKRLIGRNFGSQQIDKMKQVFTYEIVEGESSEVLVKVKDQIFTLEQISAAILRNIKESCEDAIGEEIDQAVITVPAYFNDRQRQAVRAAGRLAGLKVLRLLNEPTAAAIAYGYGRDLNDQHIAVYDLGGGTFDISIIHIKEGRYDVRATGGDTFLGGVDFDDRLMQHLMTDFADRTGVDPSYDRRAVTLLRDGAEAAKIRLSSVEKTQIAIKDLVEDDEGQSLAIDVEVVRDQLEKMTMDLVDRSIATCERILQEAGVAKSEIAEMLLVGGQSRMPLVRRKVKAFIGKDPSQKVHPDEAVAIGASIMAHSLAGKGGAQDVTLLDVLPSAIGISKPDGKMHVLFGKNQPLPDFKTKVLTTSKDNQRSIILKIYQGESSTVAENELLGTFVFAGLREAPKGAVKVEVTFHLDSEGILALTARDQSTGNLVESRIMLGKDDQERKDLNKPAIKKKPVKPGPKSVEAMPTEPGRPALKPLQMPSSSLNARPTDVAPVAATPSPPIGRSLAPTPNSAPMRRSLTGNPSPIRESVPGPAAEPQVPAPPPPPMGPISRFFAWLRGLFGRK